MTRFKITDDGSQITEEKYKCKNKICQKYDHLRRFLTSLTPSGSIQFILNPAKDSVKSQKEFVDIYEAVEYDNDGNLVSLGSTHTEEFEHCTWNFVECRSCRCNYVIEHSYNSLVGRSVESVFPLFQIDMIK